MNKKISQLVQIINPTGDEQTLVAYNGKNYRVPISAIKQLVKASDVGLGNVDNTSDMDKPVSNATITALSTKSPIVHSHSMQDITGLDTALDGKSDIGHTHSLSDITDYTPPTVNFLPSEW